MIDDRSAAPISSVIVLDLDDTLYLERDYVRSGFNAAGAWLLVERSIAGLADIAWRLFDAGARGNIFDLALQELGVAPDPRLVDSLVTVYREHYPNIQLQPDTRRFLSALHRGRALALLTDGHPISQQRKIDALGLDTDRMTPIVITGLWGREYWKPHQRGFRAIMACHDLPPSAFAYVADNATKDFIAPRALGWRTVQIVRPGCIHGQVAPEPVDMTIRSLGELTQKRLDELFKGAWGRDRSPTLAAG